MNIFLSILGLFFLGSFFGFIFELLFRRFVSTHRWVNPGFLNGPYIPLYGFGLTIMYYMSKIEINAPYRDILIVLLIGITMTIIELITGLLFLKIRVRLWDYSKQWLNYKGIICPLFSLIWLLFSGVYVFFINQFMDNFVSSIQNVTASFFLGLVFMLFLVDVMYSYDILNKIRIFAKEKGFVFIYEKLRFNNGKRRTILKRGKIIEILEEYYENFNK